MENINVQVYSLVSEPISPIEKLKTISKLGFAGAEFTADFTEVPVEEMKKVLAENNLKVDSAHVGLDQIEGVLYRNNQEKKTGHTVPYFLFFE